MPKVEHPDAPPRDLVLVRRADPAAGRADLPARRALAVEQLVVRQHQVRPIADIQAPLDIDPALHQPLDLGEQRLGIEDHAVADRAAHARMENPARDLLEDEAGGPEVHRVAGIRPALVAHDPVGPLGQDVDELSFSFVAPLGADDDEGPSLGVEHVGKDNSARR